MVFDFSRVLPAEVVRLHDEEAGLDGVIVIDNNLHGRAVGGCRLGAYECFGDAALVALRAGREVSYRNAMAGLPFGGGAAVLRRPQGQFNRAALLKAFGEAVEGLQGRYVTAGGIGTFLDDMDIVGTRTRYVVGRAAKPGTAGGDPASWTALGVFEAIKAAADFRLSQPLSELTVAVAGIGNVGLRLCRLLHEAGARLIVSDHLSARAMLAVSEFGARVVPPAEIARVTADILTPCTWENFINEKLASQVKAKVICGAASAQLNAPQIAEILEQRCVTYVPDYVANAGGAVSLAAEHLGLDENSVALKIKTISDRTRLVLATAMEQSTSTLMAANCIAERLMFERAREVV